MIKLEAATLTDPGCEREMNEDSAWAQVYSTSDGEAIGLFIVCDGMGGHMGGEVASHWAVETIKQEMSSLFSLKDPRATVRLSEAELAAAVEGGEVTRASVVSKIELQIRQAIQKANGVVYKYAQEKPQKAAEAGTTVTMAVVVGHRVIVANVGDSRTYLLRDHKLQQVSQDHSLVASLVASGQIKPEEVFTHPQRNMIFRCLGQKRQVQVDTFLEVLQPGDFLLLCSDGLWEMVQDEEVIARLVEAASTPQKACQILIDAANTAGGEDNIGVVVVKVS
ncbi:MAG: Stp1/IreP family PP2C-type Ser/Thr phosphatase [Anaerolineales bacterium]|nr:Stp1/IreP family PP2C-type Ser/Thr phosphatase [Anaerolineales bacterium]